MEKIRIIVICFAIFCALINNAQSLNLKDSLILESALVQTELYLDLIKDKRIGLVVNQSSYINETHLVDSILNLNIEVVSIFSPEHGFKGNFEAGQKVEDNIYKGIPIYSLYGNNKSPSKFSLDNIDLEGLLLLPYKE